MYCFEVYKQIAFCAGCAELNWLIMDSRSSRTKLHDSHRCFRYLQKLNADNSCKHHCLRFEQSFLPYTVFGFQIQLLLLMGFRPPLHNTFWCKYSLELFALGLNEFRNCVSCKIVAQLQMIDHDRPLYLASEGGRLVTNPVIHCRRLVNHRQIDKT